MRDGSLRSWKRPGFGRENWPPPRASSRRIPSTQEGGRVIRSASKDDERTYTWGSGHRITSGGTWERRLSRPLSGRKDRAPAGVWTFSSKVCSRGDEGDAEPT